MFTLGKSLSANSPFTRQEGGFTALKLLTLINLINYADRLIASALKSELQNSFNLNDFQSTFPGLGMAVCFTVFAWLFGWLNDKKYLDRRIIVAAGVTFWSVMTCLTAVSNSFGLLILFRSLTGVGEASYGTVASPLIFDFFPLIDRNVAYGFYVLAVPVGSAIGYGIGAAIGSAVGWRIAFLIFGIPGLLCAYSVLKINDPVRGINDPTVIHDTSIVVTGENRVMYQSVSTISVNSLECEMNTYDLAAISEKIDAPVANKPIEKVIPVPVPAKEQPVPLTSFEEVIQILMNLEFMLCIFGLAASSFGLNGLGDFLPLYLHRKHGMSVAEAGI